AAIAERLGLPGIGVETAHLMTHKVAMRRRLAEAGVPQPRFAALRRLSERRRALDEVGVPAVLKPADSGGQRGVFRIDSLVGVDLVEVQLRFALGEEPPDELVLPRFNQPLAIRFLTAEPGPLPTGRVVSVGSLEKVLAFPGVVQAETYLQVGETIRPVRLDG